MCVKEMKVSMKKFHYINFCLNLIFFSVKRKSSRICFFLIRKGGIRQRNKNTKRKKLIKLINVIFLTQYVKLSYYKKNMADY